jgi:hypothetical protein
MVDHIHQDNKYIQHTLPKGTICGSLLINLFDSDCVHIYVNKLIKISQTVRVVTLRFLVRSTSHT